MHQSFCGVRQEHCQLPCEQTFNYGTLKEDPHGSIYWQIPKVSLLCIFGCEVHVHVLQENKKIRSKIHQSSSWL